MEAPDRVEERTLLDTRRSPWAPAGPRGFDEFSHHRWINLQKIWRCIEIMEAPESAARLKDPQRLAVDGSIPVSLFLFLGSWNSKSGIDVRFGSWHLKNGIDCRQASFGMNYAEKPPYLATFFGDKDFAKSALYKAPSVGWFVTKYVGFSVLLLSHFVNLL